LAKLATESYPYFHGDFIEKYYDCAAKLNTKDLQ